MLIKLTPEQISRNWKQIKFCIAGSLPPLAEYSEAGMLEIHKKLLKDTMQCWVLLNNKEEIQAVATTVISSDIGTEVHNLLIYSLYAISYKINDDDWSQGLVHLKEYAEKVGCKKIIAYSNIPRIIDLVLNVLNGRVEYQLISLGV